MKNGVEIAWISINNSKNVLLEPKKKTMPLSEKIAFKASYSNPDLSLVYGLGSKIMREYDMNAAGFSIIKRYKLLSRYDIMSLEGMEKFERNVIIGKIRALDKDWSANLTRHIRETMAKFMKANGALDETIVSINNDAVTLIEPRSKEPVLDIDGLKFKISGEYKALVVLSRVSIFKELKNDEVTIKGISETGRELCKNALIKRFGLWLSMLDNGASKFEMLKELKNFKAEYYSRRMHMDYYRNMRNGLLRLGNCGSAGTSVSFRENFIDNEWKDHLDIGENLIDFIIPFINLVIEL